MLVIVNPYATTVSDAAARTSSSTPCSGRYDVDAVDTEGRDHATALCREAAAEGYDIVVAFGGDGTVNEAANGLAGSATRADRACPAARRTSTAACSASRTTIVDATEHLLRARRRLAAAAGSTSGRVNGRHFLFSVGLRTRRGRRATASTPTRGCKARLRRLVLRRRRPCTTFARDYLVHPPQIDARGRTARRVRGVTRHRPERATRTRTSTAARSHVAEDVALDDGHARRRGAASARRPLDVPTVPGARLFSARRGSSKHRRVIELRTAATGRALRLGRRPPDPAAGRRRLHRRHARGASTRSAPAR